MKLTFIVAVLVIILLREIFAIVFRWGNGAASDDITLSERIANIKDKWHTTGSERTIEEVTIGWRHDEGQQERVNGNGVKEYYRVIRQGNK